MKVDFPKILARLEEDPDFEQALKKQARAVAGKPANFKSREWTELLSNFATSPAELSKLQNDEKASLNTWTTLTTTTMTSLPCTCTTTTTTVSVLCSPVKEGGGTDKPTKK